MAHYRLAGFGQMSDLLSRVARPNNDADPALSSLEQKAMNALQEAWKLRLPFWLGALTTSVYMLCYVYPTLSVSIYDVWCTLYRGYGEDMGRIFRAVANSTIAHCAVAFFATWAVYRAFLWLTRTFLLEVNSNNNPAPHDESHPAWFEFVAVSLLTTVLVVEREYNGPLILYFLWYLGIGAINAVTFMLRAGVNRLPQTRTSSSSREGIEKLISCWFVLFGLNAFLAIGMSAGLASDWRLLLTLASDNVITVMTQTHIATRIFIFIRGPSKKWSAAAEEGKSNEETAAEDAEGWSAFADLFLDAGADVVRLLHLLHIWYVGGATLAFSLPHLVLFHQCNRGRQRLTEKLGLWNRHRALQYLLDTSCTVVSRQQLSKAAGGVEEGGPHPSLECPVCLEELHAWLGKGNRTGPLVAKRVPLCGHIFHRACVRQWILSGHHSCPVCRRGLTPEAESRRKEDVQRELDRDRNRAGAGEAAEQDSEPHWADVAQVGRPRIPRPPMESRAMRAAAGVCTWFSKTVRVLLRATRIQHLLRFLIRSVDALAPPAEGTDPQFDESVRRVLTVFPTLDPQSVRMVHAGPSRRNLELTIEAAIMGRIRTLDAAHRSDQPNVSDSSRAAGSNGHEHQD